MSIYCFTIGNQVLVDTLLQHGSEVFRTGGGSSILIGGNSPSDTNSLLLIPCNSEGMEGASTQLCNSVIILDTLSIFYDTNKVFTCSLQCILTFLFIELYLVNPVHDCRSVRGH